MLSICSGPVSSANRLSAHSSSRTPKRKDMERLFNYLGIDKSFTPCRPEYTLIMNTINLLKNNNVKLLGSDKCAYTQAQLQVFSNKLQSSKIYMN